MNRYSLNSRAEFAHKGNVTLFQVKESGPLLAAAEMTLQIRTQGTARQQLPIQRTAMMMTWRHFCAKFTEVRHGRRCNKERTFDLRRLDLSDPTEDSEMLLTIVTATQSDQLVSGLTIF